MSTPDLPGSTSPDADDDTGRVDLVDDAAAQRGDRGARVARHGLSMPVPTNGASAFTSGTA
jgi:hypothetical protein